MPNGNRFDSVYMPGTVYKSFIRFCLKISPIEHQSPRNIFFYHASHKVFMWNVRMSPKLQLAE